MTWKIAAVPTALLGAALFAVWPGRRRESLRAPFLRRNFAHRGLFAKDQSVPENSLPAFAAAARAGYGIELDVQFTADRRLVVFHDDTLDRMTPARGFVRDVPWQTLQTLPLAGTACRVPLFADVLRTVAAENPATPLIVEIKSRREYDGAYLAALCRAALDALRAYPGPWCVESFDPRVVRQVRRQAPNVLRGQLADSYAANRRMGAARLYAYGISHLFGNFMGRPDFIAWCPARPNWAVRLCAAVGAMRVYWTAQPPADPAQIERENDAVIFQWYTPEKTY